MMNTPMSAITTEYDEQSNMTIVMVRASRDIYHTYSSHSLSQRDGHSSKFQRPHHVQSIVPSE